MSDHDDVPVPDGFESLLRAAASRSGSPFGFGPFDEAPRPSRRRPRRRETVTYRLRVEIEGTEPPLWRGLELDSDLFLNEVHTILQAVFGWEDYHLHGFSSGGSYYSREAELYLCPFEAQEGKPGIPEEQVRLDEVLVQKGDRLAYTYDFGDDWEHLLTLQAVLPREEGAPRARCTAGKRAAPPEDCGGVPGYEFVSAATDPEHPQHAEALAEYRQAYDQDPDRTPVPFDIDAVNATLAALSEPLPDDLPDPIRDLLESVPGRMLKTRLLVLVTKALAPGEEEQDTAIVAKAVGPYSWLLEHVGDDGIKLTGAGYLPPAGVREAAEALGLTGRVLGMANREVQTLPVLNLRESAQKSGLLRKSKGRLLLTKAGRAARDDSRALWDHLAERMPPTPRAEVERLGCLLMFLLVAAESRDVFEDVADILTAMGWRLGGGDPVDSGAAHDAAYEAWVVLDVLGGWTGTSFGRGPAPTARGVAFARAALHR
ncbi:plasmid pRiA4b ORF-3 family protein [Nocardiopsis listeri]|uniref:plasmid pRiA4b ORF-3 family protein n=1 Tax=Nocardiopsis listeri TaxID=53440 RepID=UPI000836263C|nr:plasmid pRiA4b ORF-3 family protein [Nocardiopsis listeri]